MGIVIKNFIFPRGDTLTFVFHFKNSDETPIDITGYTLYFTLKEKLSDSDDDAIIKIDESDHLNPVNGDSRITVPDTDTDDLKGKYYYDFQLKTTGGVINTFMQGKIEFKSDVTRRTS